MDFTGIIGLIAGFGLIVYGIISGKGDIMNFVDIPSVAVTIGGTFAATLCSFPIGFFKDIPNHLKIAFGRNKYKPKQYIDIIVGFAQDARRKGILSLEDKVMEQEDEFLKRSVMLIVDAIDPEKTKQILENELDCLDARHMSGVKIYEKASVFAPAFGMIGTLLGLVNMLAGLDMSAADGSTKVTSGMAIALITTFYGSILANLILMPFASKLRIRHAEEMLCKEIVVEGVISIQAGDNPKHIEERLFAYLKSSQRSSLENNSDSNSDNTKSRKSKR